MDREAQGVRLLHKIRHIALLAGSIAVLLVVTVSRWLYGLSSTVVVKGSLAPEDVRVIRRVVSKERWRLVGSAVAARDFKFIRQIALARIDYVAGYSGHRGLACAVYRDRFGSGLRWNFSLQREGTNGWKFTSFGMHP